MDTVKYWENKDNQKEKESFARDDPDPATLGQGGEERDGEGLEEESVGVVDEREVRHHQDQTPGPESDSKGGQDCPALSPLLSDRQLEGLSHSLNRDQAEAEKVVHLHL